MLIFGRCGGVTDDRIYKQQMHGVRPRLRKHLSDPGVDNRHNARHRLIGGGLTCQGCVGGKKRSVAALYLAKPRKGIILRTVTIVLV